MTDLNELAADLAIWLKAASPLKNKSIGVYQDGVFYGWTQAVQAIGELLEVRGLNKNRFFKEVDGDLRLGDLGMMDRIKMNPYLKIESEESDYCG